MITYVTFEGRDRNDNDRCTNFRKRERALKYAQKSKYEYVVIHVYEGTPDDELAYYQDTIFEREAQ